MTDKMPRFKISHYAVVEAHTDAVQTLYELREIGEDRTYRFMAEFDYFDKPKADRLADVLNADLQKPAGDMAKALEALESIPPGFGAPVKDAMYAFLSEHYQTIKAALQQGDGWRPIESAPKDGTPILVSIFEFNKPDGKCLIVPAYWDGYYWREDGEYGHDLYQPTHWQPLPPPPGDTK